MMGLPLHRVDLANEKKGWQEELRTASKDSIVFGYSKLESAGKTEK